MTEHAGPAGSSARHQERPPSVSLSAVETERLLASDPRAAEARARDFLREHPDNHGALLLLACALRRQGDFTAARSVLEPLVQAQPDLILAHYELGLSLAGLRLRQDAVRVLSRAIDLAPSFAAAWLALAEQLEAVQNPGKRDPDLQETRERASAGDLAGAESLLRGRLDQSWDEGAALLLSILLLCQEKGAEALPVVAGLVGASPGSSLYRELQAAAFFQAADFESAIAGYRQIVEHAADRPGAWMSLGRALRALGRQEQCIAAFKRALELLPDWVEAYRTLASVKTYRLDSEELAKVRNLLACPNLPASSYAELHFALGRALEDVGQYSEAFDHFTRSKALQRANLVYSAEASTRFTRREISLYSPDFIRVRTGFGCPSDAPIFVVGMPRAGSTLVQEILCAHSAVQRTGELRDLTWMTARLDQESAASGQALRYPEVIRTFDARRFSALGEEYLLRTLPRRKTGKRFFVDKYPGNFYRTGFLHLILPNAKIVDVRRHPLDCCVSCFRHYFPEGMPFTQTLFDLGRYYADYVELMAHFDRVLPGKVHRVIYEQLVEDPEREVRRLLDYLNLPFEEQCLRFFENEQAVMTSSTEQVRVPINKAGLGGWRNYEKHLGPLKSALGRVLETYPAAPSFNPPMQISMTVRLA